MSDIFVGVAKKHLVISHTFCDLLKCNYITSSIYFTPTIWHAFMSFGAEARPKAKN